MQFSTEGGELPQLEGHPGYYIIGHDDIVPICLDENRNGRVVYVDDESLGELFANSNVHRFGEFLVFYQHYRLVAREMNDVEAERVVTETEQRMTACDPPSLSNPNFVWAVILEQMRAGFL